VFLTQEFAKDFMSNVVISVTIWNVEIIQVQKHQRIGICIISRVKKLRKDLKMAKKQKKTVESKKEEKVEEKVFCQHCKSRMSGLRAYIDNKQGYCTTKKDFVPRKSEICKDFKKK
jgi:hypothetical protein